jgi:hypothetical protein
VTAARLTYVLYGVFCWMMSWPVFGAATSDSVPELLAPKPK